MAIIDSIDINATSNTCGASCAFEDDSASCAFVCITDATGLSTACTECYVGSVLCTVEHCITPCMDSGNPECGTCREEHCMPAFWECSSPTSPP